MTDIESKALEIIQAKASDVLINNGSFSCERNESESRQQYSSIVYTVKNITSYTLNKSKQIKIANVKWSGKIIYISIPDKYSYILDKENIVYKKVANDIWIRLELDIFIALAETESFSPLIEKIVFDTFNSTTFDCCSRFEACRKELKCLHPDIFYATSSCNFKKHLDKGEIF